ncbi:ribbon-helix-helix protein, CopG family [Geotalea uraniireducens]|uniref:Ribbon-helix-helix protein CopG domain-containing protein n=1 Tax=Geotalea uraniireducens (strain Rf4) TaxID=351605 RepID=A5GCF9_GEOUR|nr:ribbon-helix-helix protein, CopG family [Geotalea uraniireducens]ABQ24745.1 hypothetical protein Gura_0531 [Geotalea uraniireducens Rf4]
MGARKKKPRYNVVSLRISNDEKQELDKVARLSNRNISEVMREAVGLIQVKLEKGELFQ